MHDLARRAETSIGSLYHFFPDRQSVLDALSLRHQSALRKISEQLEAIPAAVWSQLSTQAVIDRLLAPYADYVRVHPDYLPMMHNPVFGADDEAFIRTIRQVLDVRIPHVPAERRAAYSIVLNAIGTGITQVAMQTDARLETLYGEEIPRLLVLYLTDIERSAGVIE